VSLILTDGRLTARAEAEPLRDVLAELARVTGASVEGVPAAAGRPVSFAFADVPVIEGLRRILQDQPFTLVLAGVGRDERLVRVTLMSFTAAGAGEASFALPPDIPERLEMTARFARDGDVADARLQLEHALSTDSDATVRRAALHGLLARGLLDREVVLRTARGDPDARVRVEAVQALRLFVQEDPGIGATVAALAESEHDPDVRNVARTLAAELGA
jgi:hypothetical protein